MNNETQLESEWSLVEGDDKVTYIVGGEIIVASGLPIKNHSFGLLIKFIECDYCEYAGAIVKIDDADPNVFRKLIMACHCPSIMLENANEARELLKLARRFQISHLEEHLVRSWFCH